MTALVKYRSLSCIFFPNKFTRRKRRGILIDDSNFTMQAAGNFTQVPSSAEVRKNEGGVNGHNPRVYLCIPDVEV
jgi:hypothetical protein